MGKRVDSEGNLLDEPGVPDQRPADAGEQPVLDDAKKEELEKDRRNHLIHMRSSCIRQALFLISKAVHKLKDSAKYYECNKNPDFDHYHHNVGAAEQYLDLAYEELEEIMDEDHTQELIKYAPFWKDLSELGLCIFDGPRPFKEEQKAWFLSKHSTLRDKAQGWVYTYPSLEKAVEAAYKYWADGEEPQRYEGEWK
jgi:hypothetical protein